MELLLHVTRHFINSSIEKKHHSYGNLIELAFYVKRLPVSEGDVVVTS